MTTRVFQDEINAAEAAKNTGTTSAANIDQSGKLVRGDSATANTIDQSGRLQRGITKPALSQPVGTFQSALEKSGTGLSSHRVVSAYWLYRDARGFPVYKIVTESPWGSRSTNTWAVREGQFIQPQRTGVPDVPQVGQSGGSGGSGLTLAKENWMSWVTAMQDNGSLQATTAARFIQQIRDFDGSVSELNDWMRFVERNTFPAPAPHEPIFGDVGLPIGGGSGGGGGGGGFTGPEYRAPDRRVVEDFVKGSLVSLVGNIPDDAMVQRFTDVYMKDHRRNFDSVSAEIDPGASVQEAIRGTAQYKEIHKLRPDSEDERSWISSRRGAAAQGGLTLNKQEDFAITQASVAGDVGDAARAASTAQTINSGSTRGTLLEGAVKNVARSVFAGVRI